jgi:succinoglycan biosynthesis transport protein ExoP
LYADPRTGLQFLPTLVDAQFCHTDEILASKAFKTLLDNLRKDYQYIIIDLPPLAPVSDVRATAGLIDTYIYAIEWGRIKINQVQGLLSAAPEVYERLLGVALTKANLKRIGRYEYGSYYKYESYRYRQDGPI